MRPRHPPQPPAVWGEAAHAAEAQHKLFFPAQTQTNTGPAPAPTPPRTHNPRARACGWGNFHEACAVSPMVAADMPWYPPLSAITSKEPCRKTRGGSINRTKPLSPASERESARGECAAPAPCTPAP